MNQTMCEMRLDGDGYQCVNCGWWVAASEVVPPIRRECKGKASESKKKLSANIESIRANGPTRTDAEVLYIIANHCSWCPNWIPTAPKKKCKACGCGSTETVENLHRRRIKNCPRPNEPAAWTEQLLQARMNHGGKNNS